MDECYIQINHSKTLGIKKDEEWSEDEIIDKRKIRSQVDAGSGAERYR